MKWVNNVDVLYKRGKTLYLVKFKGVYHVINIFTKQTYSLENEDQFLAMGYVEEVSSKEIDEVVPKLRDIVEEV